jgi:hypothetical protein
MRILARIVAGLAAVWLGFALLAFPAEAARLEAYGRLPLIEDGQISPDGTMIALAMTDGENRIILIKRLADDQVIGGLKAGDTKIRDVRWAGSDFLLITRLFSTSQSTSLLTTGILILP